jgi:predicted Zn-dependent protease
VQKFRGLLAEVRAKAPSPEPSRGVTGQSSDELKSLGYLGRAEAGTANVPKPSSLSDPKDKIEEQNLLHRAMMATDDDRDADAIASLRKVLEMDPKSPIALRQLGELELRAGDYAQSAQHLKAALEAHPDDAITAFHEGQALEKAHDLPGARDALEASLKLMPGQLEARLLLGEVYLRLNDPKAAEPQFESALLLQANSVEGQLGLAKVQIAEGNFNQAADQLEGLSKAQSRNAEVFDLLAQAYSGMGKTAEAQQAAARAKLLRSK